MTRLPLTDQQWRAFRDRLEELAERAASGRQAEVTREELAAMLLIVLDRLDDLEKRLTA